MLFLRWAIPYFACLATGLFCAYHSGKRTPAKGRWLFYLSGSLVLLAVGLAWLPMRSNILTAVTLAGGGCLWAVLLYAGDRSRQRKQQGGAS